MTAAWTEVTGGTGASSGIGRAIAEALLAQGKDVVNLDYVLPDWRHPQLMSYQAQLFPKSNPEGAPQTQRILDSIAVGRMGTADDVARAAMFFLSPDNGSVTGQVLYVCGGTTLGTAPV